MINSRDLRLHAPIVLLGDSRCSVVRDGVVDIGYDGRIRYAGPVPTAPVWDGEVRRVTGILLPGLINTHAHSAMTALRGRGGDLPLIDWLQQAMWPAEALMTPEDARAGMLLGSIEMLRGGVTTSSEMYFAIDEHAEAVLETGGRAILAEVIFELPGGEDWGAAVERVNKRIDYLGLRTGPDERIEFGYGPHSAYMLPPHALGVIAGHARDRKALVHMHVAESPGEDVEQRSRFGSVPRLLQETGLLDARLVAAHAVHLSDADIDLFAASGTGVAHCPASNAKLASGILRLKALRKAGVPVGLGTDGPASNDRLDLLDEARTAALLARVSTSDARTVSAADALLLATRYGAEALGRNDIGALEVGRWADIVHIGVDTPAFATGLDVDDEELLGNLIWSAGSRTVRDVWVAGDRVVADGGSVRTDRQRAQAQVAASAARLRVPPGPAGP